ncbi:MAG: universal stress protein E [Paraglaciecola sp.]|jgi:universal stress protein E
MEPTMGVGWANINLESIKINTSNVHKNKMETLLKEHDLFIHPYHVLEGQADIVIHKVTKILMFSY